MNSFCTFNMDDNTVVMLDQRGLFKSQGDIPQPFTPVFNEFLIDYLERYKLELGQNVRLEWDDRKKFLYMSISLSEFSPLYERAFACIPSIDKWGTLDSFTMESFPFLFRARTVRMIILVSLIPMLALGTGVTLVLAKDYRSLQSSMQSIRSLRSPPISKSVIPSSLSVRVQCRTRSMIYCTPNELDSTQRPGLPPPHLR